MSVKATETIGSNMKAGALALLQPILAEEAETFTARDMAAAQAVGVVAGVIIDRLVGDSIPLTNKIRPL